MISNARQPVAARSADRTAILHPGIPDGFRLGCRLCDKTERLQRGCLRVGGHGEAEADLPDISGAPWSVDEEDHHSTIFEQGSAVRVRIAARRARRRAFGFVAATEQVGLRFPAAARNASASKGKLTQLVRNSGRPAPERAPARRGGGNLRTRAARRLFRWWRPFGVWSAPVFININIGMSLAENRVARCGPCASAAGLGHEDPSGSTGGAAASGGEPNAIS
jgi:hypothetical protein